MAPSTTWLPAPNIGRTATTTWLFLDGTEYDHPPLEISSSGRRVRFQGLPKSFGVNQVDASTLTLAQAEAAKRGTQVWMPKTDETLIVGTLNFGTPLELPKNWGESGHGRAVTATWLYRHPTLNVSSTISVGLNESWNGSGVLHVQQNSFPTNPSTSPRGFIARTDKAAWGWGGNYAENSAWQNWLQKEYANDMTEVHKDLPWGRHGYATMRPALQEFFIACRSVNQLAQMHVPDLRDPSNPRWMALDLVNTNYTHQFDQQIAEQVDTVPLIGELKKATDKVITTLRNVGIVVDDMPERAYTQAMSGDLTELVANLQPDHDNIAKDPFHRVALNLATGTVAVSCMHDHTRKDQVAQAYENAKFMASLKGEEDEFLVYARAYLENEAREAAQKIIDERQERTIKLTTAVTRQPDQTGGK